MEEDLLFFFLREEETSATEIEAVGSGGWNRSRGRSGLRWTLDERRVGRAGHRAAPVAGETGAQGSAGSTGGRRVG
jgi:hypothetical protein